jgi:hypothetical protein
MTAQAATTVVDDGGGCCAGWAAGSVLIWREALGAFVVLTRGWTVDYGQ